MAGPTPTSVSGRLNRAEILAVYGSARSCIDGAAHIEAAREAVLWIIDPPDAEERAFRYGCVMATSGFRTGRMDPKRFQEICLDIADQVNTIATLIQPKKKTFGRKKTT